jgi:uncharacterized protein
LNRLLTRLLPAALILALNTAHSQTTEQVSITHYNYDASLPLNPVLKELPDETESLAELRKRWHLTYSSTNGERVTSIFTLPQKFAGPYPAVILLAGSGGHKDTDYVRIASNMFSTMGYATLSIDAQYHGERSKPGKSGDIHLIGKDDMRDAWIQTVVDLRRAVDFLVSRRNIDTSNLGYLGFSQGGMIGGTFIGVEPRIKAACLAIPGGGFYEEGKKRGLVTPENDVQFLANAKMTDPMYFLGQFSPRPLLVLSAKKDELIPKSMTDALYNAAKDPKGIKWYNSGHVLPPTALITDAKEFFLKHLGERRAVK